MTLEHFSYSPNVSLTLKSDDVSVRLADVCENSATLFEPALLLPNTRACIIVKVGDRERHHQIIIRQSLPDDMMILFSLDSPGKESVKSESFQTSSAPLSAVKDVLLQIFRSLPF